ncbi:rIIB-like protein [Escherichia phage vB_EcoP_SP5M]|uniref:RIIB-like protein n=1 Tax=Escherichia phage vB_EcoP_SP5M TaxID=2750853 RepID=A0A7D5JFQ7_9CAUD|nr:RIIB lysis inhibitor [Escherichia phage vB_EcoP_SP5M]QLF80673.1 rIIB-like protein [Escherichia phage vB_EcoP_SP5M]
MKIEMISIIALAVDSRNLTLWKPDGSTVVYPQSDPRVARIVSEAQTKGLGTTQDQIEVNIAPEVELRTEYLEAEKNTNGFVRFFKVAKAKLKEFFEDGTGVQPARIVSDIKLGNPTKTLVSKAMDTFLAVQANEPEVTVTNGCFDKRDNLMWVIGWDKDHNHPALVRFINDVLGWGYDHTHRILRREWPIGIRAVSDDEMGEFAKQAQNIKGVHIVFTNREETPLPYVEVAKTTNQNKLAAVSEKLAALGAISTDDANFHTDVKEDEVVVAVTNNGVIPGVENLQRHLRQSAKLKDYKGFTKFLERLAPVIKDRLHSVEDLMKFMETAELPIADDGSILFLKRLQYKDTEDGKRVFVDCHSGNIRQWVGCKVQVREDLVDPDRRQDCSNGLHVASMSYIRSFGGNVTILGKVAPEDVFAVPQYNTNKMRVSAYHIIAELPEEERNNVNNGIYLSKTAVGKKLLNDAIVGNHSSPTTLIMVGGHYGTNLKYTNLSSGSVEQFRTVASKEALNMEESLNEAVAAEPVKATDLKPVNKKTPTVKEQIQELVKEFLNTTTPEDKLAAADLLVELRSKARKPWGAFDVGSDVVAKIADVRATYTAKPIGKPKAVKQDKTGKPTKSKPAINSTNANIIRGYLADNGMSDYQKAHSIHDLKRAAKKSYTAMGLTEEECKAIDKLKHHLK